MLLKLIQIVFIIIFPTLLFCQEYFWYQTDTDESVKSIETPAGYKRIAVQNESFAIWLQNLPLKPCDTAVLLFDGTLKSNQSAHFRVIDMDVERGDLQQCADAIIRLHAEFLYSTHNYNSIHFNFTSGDTARFTDWIQGIRPVVTGNSVNWANKAELDSSYNNFRKYLRVVMIYAGTLSLSKELTKIENINEMQIGDIFIQGGSPGHAVIVIDMAVNPESGGKVFLLAQSYMPAQDVHILKSFDDTNPWYRLDNDEMLRTPEWTFKKDDLYRFREE